MTSKTKVTAIACSILKREIEYMRSQKIFDFDVVYLDSSLHMMPMELYEKMNSEVNRLLAMGVNVLLIYGDCHPYIVDISKQASVARTKASSCIEILTGKTEYKKLMKEEAFVLLAEWVVRRGEILVNIPGYKNTDSIDLMNGLHKKLVFLDTGICPLPCEDIRHCSEFYRMPCEIKKINLDVFRDTVNLALTELLPENYRDTVL